MTEKPADKPAEGPRVAPAPVEPVRDGPGGRERAQSLPADEDGGPCQTDADCGFTRVAPGVNACCPMLCAPRVVSKKRAQELDARIATCNAGRQCPEPMCRPPLRNETAACVARRCVGRPAPLPRD